MNTHMYRRLFALLIVVVFGVVACSSGSGASGSTSPTPSAPVATTGSASGTCPASAGLPANTNIHGAVAASGNQFSIEAGDFFFSPTCLTKVPGGTVTLTVHNSGVTLHNVSIPSLRIDMDMASGQTITVKVKMGSAPQVYFCKYHRGAGMLGALLPAGSGS
jgi:plastocyanin